MKMYNALKEIRWEHVLTFINYYNNDINMIIPPTHQNNHFAAFILICDACNFIAYCDLIYFFLTLNTSELGLGLLAGPSCDERKSVISHI